MAAIGWETANGWPTDGQRQVGSEHPLSTGADGFDGLLDDDFARMMAMVMASITADRNEYGDGPRMAT